MPNRNRIDDRPVRPLEARIGLLEEEKRLLEDALRRTSEELQRCLAERRLYLDSYLGAQQQNTTLMNLYVASRRLHSSVNREEVLVALQEIIVNLVGSEEVVILERDGSGRVEAVSVVGVTAEQWRGAPVIETCLRDGETFVGEPGGAITACIPLRIGNSVFGAIAVFALLRQKDGLTDVDRELFELLATHAGIALYCSSLHARHSGTR